MQHDEITRSSDTSSTGAGLRREVMPSGRLFAKLRVQLPAEWDRLFETG